MILLFSIKLCLKFNILLPAILILAQEIKEVINTSVIGLDDKWGLEHGTWSVIRPMYPKADIPVVQLSLGYTQAPAYHYQLGKQLNKLRRKGILIIGSANMVHN